ncbi:MAG TPA: carboxypeptidase-like regulatory domain-containing protein [Abditibacterium sp.]|jgi:hypothetical protein
MMSILHRSTFGLAALVILSPYLRAETLTGKVVGPDDKPSAATVYFVQNQGWSTTEKQVQTDPDGSFRFEVQPATVPKGIAAFPASEKARGGVAIYAPGLSLGTAFLEADEPSIVKLLPPRRISGILRDDKGAPVANATLRVSHFFQGFGSRQNRKTLFFDPPVPLRPQFTVKTDAKGNWQILGAPPLASATIQLDDDRFVDAGAQFNSEGEVDGPGRQNIIARRAGSISGRVLGVKGEPAAGVQVIASAKPGQANGRSMGGIATTAIDGTFRMPRVTPGTYTLLIHDLAAERAGFGMEGEISKRPEPIIAPALENVLVEAGQVAGNNTFQLVTPAIVTGRVVDAKSGLPLGEVSVGAFGKGAPRTAGLLPATLTDKEGRFKLALVPGANAIYAYEAGRWGSNTPTDPVSAAVTLVAGANKAVPLRVQRRFADVQGQIVKENGAPASGVEITLWNTRGTGQYIRSDEKGHFDLKRMDIGTLRLDPPHEWTVVSPKNIVLPAAAPVRIVVRRNQMARVSVRVVDSAGKPVAGAKMRFTMPIVTHEGHDARSIMSPVSDAAGQYVFEALKMPEALQLKLENAAKKGYKFRSGGATTGAKANDEDFSLSDIVMESLGGSLKGIVHQADGAAVEGALVRSSGDVYESVTKTDTAGAFTLPDQPQGEVEVLAAHGRSFGRVKVNDSDAGAKIVLQSGTAPPPRDIERAVALFREMAPSADARTLGKAAQTLAPFEPATALELLLLAPDAKPDAARAVIMGNFPLDAADETLSWAQKELPQIAGDTDYVRSGAKLGLLLAARQKEAAQAVFDQINARRAKLTGDAAFVGVAWTAALAERLELPIASRLFDEALASAIRANTVRSIVEPLSSGSTAFAEAILSELPEGKEDNIYSYRQAIQQVARHDVMGAHRLLEQMRVLVDAVPERPTENEQYRGRDSFEFDWAFAAKDVLRALPRTEAETAGGIARQVKLWHRPSALALAAEFGTKEQRLGLARETIAAETRGPWMEGMTKTRVGALVFELDEALAGELFEQSAKDGEESRREHGSGPSVDWGFYASFWNPAQARLTLEADWARLHQKEQKPSEDKYNALGWNQASLAMAMSAVDLDRALEWARQISDKPSPNNPSPRSRALEFMGELLLQEPGKRRLMVISSESGFDN